MRGIIWNETHTIFNLTRGKELTGEDKKNIENYIERQLDNIDKEIKTKQEELEDLQATKDNINWLAHQFEGR